MRCYYTKILLHSGMTIIKIYDDSISLINILSFAYQLIVIAVNIFILNWIRNMDIVKAFVEYMPLMVSLIVCGIVFSFMSLFVNACIEFIIRILYKDSADNYLKKVRERQAKFYNYDLAAVTVAAIYAALYTSNSKEINYLILMVSGMTIVCMLITDFYFSYMYEKKIVDSIYKDFLKEIY